MRHEAERLSDVREHYTAPPLSPSTLLASRLVASALTGASLLSFLTLTFPGTSRGRTRVALLKQVKTGCGLVDMCDAGKILEIGVPCDDLSILVIGRRIDDRIRHRQAMT